jgi:hypothetical protein
MDRTLGAYGTSLEYSAIGFLLFMDSTIANA